MSSHVLWLNIEQLTSKRFVCGYCGSDITSNEGFRAVVAANRNIRHSFVYICHNCDCASYFIGDKQYPGARIGQDIKHLPVAIQNLHNEIRDAMAAGAHTSAVLSARKLLMHIAVECGAEVGQSFALYVDYLVTNNYAPPNSKAWIDRIRKAGNEANHEIIIFGSEESTNILKFIEMLLLFIYEFPAGTVEEKAVE